MANFGAQKMGHTTIATLLPACDRLMCKTALAMQLDFCNLCTSDINVPKGPQLNPELKATSSVQAYKGLRTSVLEVAVSAAALAH